MLTKLLYALSFISLAHAWTFLYTNATNNATILHESGTVNCTKIDLAKGKEFSWDPEDADLCISIYYDKSCTSRGGLSCNAWKKDSGNSYESIQIFTNDDTASASASISSSPTPTSITSSISMSPTLSATNTSTAHASSSSSSSSSSNPSLSGGAIAGIVIGVIAAVLIIGIILFYAGRRNRRIVPADPFPVQSLHKPTLSDMQTAMPPHEFAFASSEKTPPPSRGRPIPGSKLVELPGSPKSAELENSPVGGMGADAANLKFNHF
ncbi:hypothetical protein N7509_007409 [Penicillium cosmopolitanum]|uniref:Mid2 domain-containing protein n=1 Tax=Penicillium cosmopolitanum TaxID=1131564 RepID=A0A9W9VYY5_9EURO|nr:uncharacterized protein N7509_007409 [Penicillium cosmopolitanum]KAJ5391919.1 hypothetical protein N7509_007409 [Penicillium cosmopolitanum]